MLVVDKILNSKEQFIVSEWGSPLKLKILDTETGVVDTVDYDDTMKIFGVYKYDNKLISAVSSDIFLKSLVYFENVKSYYIDQLDVDFASDNTRNLDFDNFTLTCSHESGSKLVFVHYVYLDLLDSAFILKLSKMGLSDSVINILDFLDKLFVEYADLLNRDKVVVYCMCRKNAGFVKISIDLPQTLKRFIVKARTLKC